MPRRATRVPLDDLASLDRTDNPSILVSNEDGTVTSAESILDTEQLIPSLEGIARVFGVNLRGEGNGNDWAQVVQRLVSPEAQATARINRSGIRTRRIQRDAIDQYRREANPIPHTPIIRILDENGIDRMEQANEDLRENASVDKTPVIRKMRGKIVICQKAMRGGCPVLIGRAETEDSMTLDDFWCVHMVPHAHRGDQCGEPYEREYSLPKKPLRRQSCKYSQCAPMEAVPEHRRWQTEKKSKGKLLTHKRTLII